MIRKWTVGDEWSVECPFCGVVQIGLHRLDLDDGEVAETWCGWCGEDFSISVSVTYKSARPGGEKAEVKL